ncbi:MAG: ADYC domain-containing protein, partial [Byssovorax sp.]
TSINGTVLTSPSVPGGDFTGSRWEADLSNGDTLELRIDGSAALPAPNAGVMTYQVSYANGAGWTPLCGLDGAGSPVAAIAMTGTWSQAQGVPGGGAYTPDLSKITFACRGRAIAKCLEMGYRPGEEPGGLFTPARIEHLVACTRLLRADYCGDGRSWTVDGTLVNLYDNVGVQLDTQAWKIEAEWTSAGARCTNKAPLTRLSVSGLTPPSCFAPKVSASCGDLAHFATGTTLMDEFAH